MTQQIRELKLLEQLIGEWIVGVAMKTSNGKASFWLRNNDRQRNASPTGHKLRNGHAHRRLRRLR